MEISAPPLLRSFTRSCRIFYTPLLNPSRIATVSAMATPDPNLMQRMADLLGRLSVIESLLPQVADARLRATMQSEIIQVKNLVQQLQS